MRCKKGTDHKASSFNGDHQSVWTCLIWNELLLSLSVCPSVLFVAGYPPVCNLRQFKECMISAFGS